MWTLVGDQQGGLAKICGQGWANSINGYQLRVRTTVKSMNPWWLLCFEILPGDKQSFGGVDHTPWTKMFLCSLGKLKNLFAKHSSYASSLCGHDLQDWFSPAERPPDPLRDVVSRNPRSKKGGDHRGREISLNPWGLHGWVVRMTSPLLLQSVWTFNPKNIFRLRSQPMGEWKLRIQFDI